MFERVMDACGFVFCKTGGCSTCDARGMCRKVSYVSNDRCVNVGFHYGVGWDGCFKFKRVAM